MHTVQMTSSNLLSFLDWNGSFFETIRNPQGLDREIEQVKRYPSLAEEGAPNFFGMAKLIAKYNIPHDPRKVIPVL